jgi:hypothetical protein
MGFFSSRKPDDDYVESQNVVQVIRSRFVCPFRVLVSFPALTAPSPVRQEQTQGQGRPCTHLPCTESLCCPNSLRPSHGHPQVRPILSLTGQPPACTQLPICLHQSFSISPPRKATRYPLTPNSPFRCLVSNYPQFLSIQPQESPWKCIVSPIINRISVSDSIQGDTGSETERAGSRQFRRSVKVSPRPLLHCHGN